MKYKTHCMHGGHFNINMHGYCKAVDGPLLKKCSTECYKKSVAPIMLLGEVGKQHHDVIGLVCDLLLMQQTATVTKQQLHNSCPCTSYVRTTIDFNVKLLLQSWHLADHYWQSAVWMSVMIRMFYRWWQLCCLCCWSSCSAGGRWLKGLQVVR